MSTAPGHWTASIPYRSDTYRRRNRDRMRAKRAERDSAYARYDREYAAEYFQKNRYRIYIRLNERANERDQELLDSVERERARRDA